jgi:hypothetical protein
MVLLRSGPIVYVELRGIEPMSEPAMDLRSDEYEAARAALSDTTLDLAGGPPLPAPPSTGSRGGDTVPPPRFASGGGAVDYLAATGESTVTLTMPLYRPEAQPFVRR